MPQIFSNRIDTGMGRERALAPNPTLTGLLIASHRVLPHRPMLAVSARTEAYTWHQGSQTDLLLPVLVHRPILGVSAPIQSYNWYHWYQQGDRPSAGRGRAPLTPTPRKAYGGPRLSKPSLIASSLASNFV